MDGGPVDGVGVVEVPSIQDVHSQEAMVADLLQQAAEAGGVVQGQAGVVLDQGFYKLVLFLCRFVFYSSQHVEKKTSPRFCLCWLSWFSGSCTGSTSADGGWGGCWCRWKSGG